MNDPETAGYLAMSWLVSMRDQADWFERLGKDSEREKLAIELLQGEFIGFSAL